MEFTEQELQRQRNANEIHELNTKIQDLEGQLESAEDWIVSAGDAMDVAVETLDECDCKRLVRDSPDQIIVCAWCLLKHALRMQPMTVGDAMKWRAK